MKYTDMKKKVFASGIVPDGYNGKTAIVDFAWNEGITYTVAKCGYYPSSIPESESPKEALQLLKKHHTASNITELARKNEFVLSPRYIWENEENLWK